MTVHGPAGRGERRRCWQTGVAGLSVLGVVVLGAGCGDDSQIDAYERQRAAQIAAYQRSQTTTPATDRAASETGQGSGETDIAATEVERTGVVVPVFALDNSFRPDTIEVNVGDEVLWENRGQNEHDILSVEGTSESTAQFGIELGKFGPGAVYSFVFVEPGAYRYYCTIHGNDRVGMIGTIIVH